MAGMVAMSGLMTELGMEERDSHLGREEGQLRGFAQLRALGPVFSFQLGRLYLPQGTHGNVW